MSANDDSESGEQRPERVIDPYWIPGWSYLQMQKSLKKGGGPAVLRKNPNAVTTSIYCKSSS